MGTKQQASQIRPELSGTYHKSRRQLVLWSAFLLVWAFIGIDLDKLAKGGGLAAGFVDSLISKQAIPWAMCFIVIYFGWKTKIDWELCDGELKTCWWARMDLGSGIFLGALSLLLFFYQKIFKVRMADYMSQNPDMVLLVIAAISGFALAFMPYRFGPLHLPPRLFYIPKLLVVLVSGSASVYFPSFSAPLLGLTLGCLVGLISRFLFDRWSNWRELRREEIGNEAIRSYGEDLEADSQIHR